LRLIGSNRRLWFYRPTEKLLKKTSLRRLWQSNRYEHACHAADYSRASVLYHAHNPFVASAS
jgi:hypothetical protein